MTSEPVVFVVDDDAAICKSLRFLIDSVGLKVETYQTAEAFLEAYDPSRPGCLVLDVRMPGMGGLQVQQELAARGSQLPVIIITGYAEVPMAVRAVKGGAVDFIEKPFGDEQLLQLVRQALDTDRKNREQRAERDVVVARLASLTAREREVLDAVVSGKANKVIALELGVATKTVEAHRARLMKKLQVDSVADLIRLIMMASRR